MREWWLRRWPAAQTVFYESEVSGDDQAGWRLRRGGVAIPGDLAEIDMGDGPVQVRTWTPLIPHPLGTLATCARCLSVWVGLAAVAALVWVPTPVLWVVMAPFAFSQLVIFARRWE